MMTEGANNWSAKRPPDSGDIHVLARQRIGGLRSPLLSVCGERLDGGYFCEPKRWPATCSECRARARVDLP